MFVNDLLTGIGRRLFQRLVMMLVVVVALRAAGYFLAQSEDENFRSASSEMVAGSPAGTPDEDGLRGTGPAKSEPRRPPRERDSSGTPAYDPGEDGGWGSS